MNDTVVCASASGPTLPTGMRQNAEADTDLHLPVAAAAASLSGRWKYAWLHLVLWGSCGEKGQVELMDYSRTQRGCRLSNAAGCLSRTHHFYDNLSKATAGIRGQGAITSVPALCRIYCKQNQFSGYFQIFLFYFCFFFFLQPALPFSALQTFKTELKRTLFS